MSGRLAIRPIFFKENFHTTPKIILWYFKVAFSTFLKKDLLCQKKIDIFSYFNQILFEVEENTKKNNLTKEIRGMTCIWDSIMHMVYANKHSILLITIYSSKY